MTTADSHSPTRGTGEAMDQAAERLRQTGRETVSDVQGELRDRFEQGKNAAADAAARSSEVLQHTSSDFSDQGQEMLARASSMLAGQLSNLAGRLENRSAAELSQDVRNLARSNPELFVAGGVAIGLVLSRFFKASAERAEPRSGAGSYGTGSSDDSYGTGWSGADEHGDDGRQRSGGPSYGAEAGLPPGAVPPASGPLGTGTPEQASSRVTPSNPSTNQPGSLQGGDHE